MPENIPVKTPLLWADKLRIFATLMVIAIHLAAPLSQERTDYDTFFWWSGNFWDGISRPGVTLFVMLSGFLLLGRDYPLSDFFFRRFTRVVVPAFFWMLAYSFYDFKAHGAPSTLVETVRGLVHGPVHYHLWYIYLIVGLYFMVPILRAWVKQAREQDYLYFFAVCILGTWVYKILAFFFHLHIGIYFEFFTNQGGHFVLGYYLGNKLLPGDAGSDNALIRPWRLTARQIKPLAVALILLGSSVTLLGMWWFSKAQGKYFPFFYDYLSPNVSIASIGWFLLARFAWNKRPLLEVEKQFARVSFGIYLVHVLVMDMLNQAGYYQSRCYPIVCIPMTLTMIALLSMVICSILGAFPLTKKLV